MATPYDPTDVRFGALYDELPLWSAPFGQALLERVPLVRGSTILDVGCGTGFLSVELVQRCTDATVIAVDPWPAAIERLRDKARALGLSLDLRQTDAATLALPDHSVDLVVCNLGIHNFDDPDAVLANLHRVLRPGGSLWLSTNLEGHMAELYTVFAKTLARLGHHDRLPILAAHEARRGSVSSIRSSLQRAGFTVPEPTTSAFRMRFSDGRALFAHHFMRLGFLDGWRSIPRPDRVDATMDALRDDLDTHAGNAGLTLTVPMAVFGATPE